MAIEKELLDHCFVKSWAITQHQGVIDTKLAASACRTLQAEAFENMEIGMRMMEGAIYVRQLRRTKDYGELQSGVWAAIQGPYVKAGEIPAEIDPSVFLDSSFIAAANDWTTDDVKKIMNEWAEANADAIID